ncbi:MAG: LytTR family DNA-binding domain-containing protein [Phaeodactylibacter sp.]|uniref:LytR/AlgR family response regulator transcription factor n=1 Tax=Phaeodactylibacter sp. TaxID=1940289 RepID=UPI0032ED5EDB
MIKAVIVEDEAHARLTLKSKLEAFCPEIQLLGMADTPGEGQKLIQELKPELVFLDIAMPGESGFDLLRRLDNLNFEIIFVTGFDNFAIDAINFCAIGYILKPIQNSLLIKAVHNATERIRERRDNDRNKALIRNLEQPGSSSNRIGIPTEEGLEFVPTSDIIRCEGQNRLTILFLSGGQTLVSSYNIGEFVRLLEPYGFFQVHRSHLINHNRILRYNRDGQVTMEDQSQVPVSKRRKGDFLQRLTRL